MAESESPDIVCTGSRVVYQNRWIRVREDAIRRADGSSGIYSVVERADFAVIAAVQDGHIWLVEQFRYPVGGRYRELPQGAWEDDPGKSPEEVARGELREETGLVARRMEFVHSMFIAYGLCTQRWPIQARDGQTRARKALRAFKSVPVAWSFITQHAPVSRFADLMQARCKTQTGLFHALDAATREPNHRHSGDSRNPRALLRWNGRLGSEPIPAGAASQPSWIPASAGMTTRNAKFRS